MRDKALRVFDKKQFNNKLLTWFKENKRNLPWRHTSDPYQIWVSEIMLQQTKVDTVISYYKNFMKKYPTVYELAAADEQEVLKEWEGLGYYSRARNLHAAVKEVVTVYDGQVPKDAKKLGKLKGIGPYTQGAIMSIAFSEPEPAVDGNVMRVLSRVLYLEDNISEQKTRKRFESIVREIICQEDPSSFNQGLMELGALICTPKSPACLHCPVRSECRVFHEGNPEKLPIKYKAKPPKTMTYFGLLCKDKSGKIAIEKRPAEGLLANMWQFPMIEIKQENKDIPIELIEKKYGFTIYGIEKVGKIKHVFTHLIWDITVYIARCKDIKQLPNRCIFIDEAEFSEYPFSVAHTKMMDYLLQRHD